MVQRHLNSIPVVSKDFESVSNVLRERAGFGFTSRPQHPLQSQNRVVTQKHPGFPMDARVVSKRTRMVGHGPTLDVELKAEAGYSSSSPAPDCVIGNFRDDSGRLASAVKAFSVLVDIGRVLLHRRRMPAVRACVNLAVSALVLNQSRNFIQEGAATTWNRLRTNMRMRRYKTTTFCLRSLR